MQEPVGCCKICQKQIFCYGGFINGIVMEDKTLLCFDCFERENEHEHEQE